MKKNTIIIGLLLCFFYVSCLDDNLTSSLDKEAFTTVKGDWRIEKIIYRSPSDTVSLKGSTLTFGGSTENYSPNVMYPCSYTNSSKQVEFQYNVYSDSKTTKSLSIGEADKGLDSLKVGLGTYQIVNISDNRILLIKDNKDVQIFLSK